MGDFIDCYCCQKSIAISNVLNWWNFKFKHIYLTSIVGKQVLATSINPSFDCFRSSNKYSSQNLGMRKVTVDFHLRWDSNQQPPDRDSGPLTPRSSSHCSSSHDEPFKNHLRDKIHVHRHNAFLLNSVRCPEMT